MEHGSTESRPQVDDATDHAGQDVAVRVGALDGFYVEDDGAGLPAADRERAFESGYSTAGDAMGFGLAIVREVVDANDWTTTVSESETGGARFEITT